MKRAGSGIKRAGGETETCGEGVEGVVLAAEGDNEDAAGVGVAGEGREEVGRHLVVGTELRAAVGVGEGESAACGGETFAERCAGSGKSSARSTLIRAASARRNVSA